MLHMVADVWLYATLKVPMYAYESVEDFKEAMPYHRIRQDGRKAKLRRMLHGKCQDAFYRH